VPLLVPARLVRHVPVVPLDDEIAVSMVHAEDVADALLRILERRAPGPFNLAAGAIGADGIADVLGARRVPRSTSTRPGASARRASGSRSK
jgi:UDP-glucose 4-epimerase